VGRVCAADPLVLKEQLVGRRKLDWYVLNGSAMAVQDAAEPFGGVQGDDPVPDAEGRGMIRRAAPRAC
jgi:hypothetical protein